MDKEIKVNQKGYDVHITTNEDNEIVIKFVPEEENDIPFGINLEDATKNDKKKEEEVLPWETKNDKKKMILPWDDAEDISQEEFEASFR